ncbi:hypothetical protein [Winogradskyella poriferorum]|uniref:hypothetical protein n=1 Tax=Winogradskyella poriferorum TaxID=307627 RepID=UPI003D646CAE
MKKIKVLQHSKLAIIIAFFGFLSQISAQSYSADNTTLQSTYENSIKTIESQSYEFRAYLSFDGFKRTKNASKVSIKNKSITGTLIALEGDNSNVLKFNDQSIKGYKVNIDEAGKVIDLNFRSTINGVGYKFDIKILLNGNAVMTVFNANNSMEYRGNVVRI